MAKSIEDAILAAGVSDVDAATALRFSGYLGNTTTDSRVRLYLNEQLNEYIDFFLSDVLATIELGGPTSPHVLLVVKPIAKVQYVTSRSEEVPADFLAGEIAQRYVQETAIPWTPWANQQTVRRASIPCTSIARNCRGIGPEMGDGPWN